VVLTEGVDVDVAHDNHVAIGLLLKHTFANDFLDGLAVPLGEEL
jgi:hypothetical protein